MCLAKRVLFFLLLALQSVEMERAWAEEPSVESRPMGGHSVRILGQVLERGTQTPLADVAVYLLPNQLKARTDKSGYFEMNDIPEGKFKWIVNQSGYLRFEQEDEQKKDQSNEVRKFYLERNSYLGYETTVYGKKNKRDESSQTLTKKEFLQVPGARGDPIKAVENLPGVARTNSFQAQVIIQGSAPQDTRYSIDGHEVPIIFHFGGLSSVLIPESIENVDYLAAGYGPEYGRALGGQVTVTTRAPKLDRLQGFAFVDTFNSGGMIETPLSEKSSILFSVRQSYIGSVLKSALKGDSDFDLTVAPEFRDLTSIFKTELTHRDTLKIVGVASQDTLEFLFTQPLKTDPALRGNFSSNTSFFRIIPQLTHRHSDITTSRYSFGLGRDWIRVNLGSNYFNLQTYSLSHRFELERKMNSYWTSNWGMDHLLTWANVNLDLPGFSSQGGIANPVSASTQRRASVNQSYQTLGFYWRNQFHDSDSPWTVMPSLRTEYYSSTHQTIVLPRLATRYQMNDSTGLKLMSGLYAQPPQPQEVDGTVGNPDVKANRGFHLALGLDKDFREGSSNGFDLTSGPFFKYLYNQVIPSIGLIERDGVLVPENYKNLQTGKVIGLQTLLKYRFNSWSGWLSYTVSRSTRSDDQASNYLFQYDQTHILTLLTSVDLSKNWKISGRFRYSSGNPYTPIVGGVFDADNDVYLPVRGAFYSERLEPFYQLDVRVDKKWIYDKWILSLYLDIQNITNHQNIQQLQYAYNYTSSTKISGLPIIPTFGLKGEF